MLFIMDTLYQGRTQDFPWGGGAEFNDSEQESDPHPLEILMFLIFFCNFYMHALNNAPAPLWPSL